MEEPLKVEEAVPEKPAGERPSGEKPVAGYRGKHRRRRRVLFEIIQILVIITVAVFITMFLRAYVLDNYEIPTGSMEPTIEINDRVFAEKVSYRFGSPAPGDIVTFSDPIVAGRVLIKRCIAVGGQTVDLVNGKVVVDGVALDEPYTQGKQSAPLDQMSGVHFDYPYRVPEGMIWVMGDNRTNSLDSRYFGPIAEEDLIGKALFRFLPLDRFGLIK